MSRAAYGPYPVAYGVCVSLSIEERAGVKYVNVHAPLYSESEWQVKKNYTSATTDKEILRDPEMYAELEERYASWIVSNPTRR